MRLVLLCTLLVGCGFTAPVQGTAPGVDARPVSVEPGVDAAGLTPQAFITQLVTLECEQAFLCRSEYPAQSRATFEQAWGTSLNDCVITDDDYLARETIAAAVVGGTITFDPTSAAACLAAPGIPTACATLFADDYDYVGVCQVALSGHVPDGAACTTDWECAWASECVMARCART